MAHHGVAVLAYFRQQNIKWHDGQGGNPSNHLCDSQVCCVNFLYPFAAQPGALAHLLRPFYPDLAEMLPVEAGQYVVFEWIGAENYLGEKLPRHGQRWRGALFTSADAAVRFRRQDGLCQMVLIEWKYTERYSNTDLRYARGSRTDRTAIYRPLYEREDCPLRRDLLPDFAALFYEPFYQFMRQQFLAHEMERTRELGADVVSVLHIAPAANRAFGRVTSPRLTGLGETATGVWGNLLHAPDRFLSVSTEDLFGRLSAAGVPELADWLQYVEARYPWARGGPGTPTR